MANQWANTHHHSTIAYDHPAPAVSSKRYNHNDYTVTVAQPVNRRAVQDMSDFTFNNLFTHGNFI